MTHASLFSGIGGAEIAATWMGWQNLFHCEINPFCRKVLEYHYPNSTSYEDITKTDFTPWRGRVDVLSGGFPCQPFSVAGQRKGADDDRYLWPQVVRVIRETQPAWVVGENVAGLLTMVQPGEEVEVGSDASLFGEDDRKRVLLRQEYVIETVCRDLEREEYAVQPFVIPACAVGAPHRRDRVWIVAHRTDTRFEGLQHEGKDGVHAVEPASDTDSDRQRNRESQQVSVHGRKGTPNIGILCKNGTAAYAKCIGRNKNNHDNGEFEEMQQTECGKMQPCGTDCSQDWWRNFPTHPPVCRRDDGFPVPMDGITFSKWRQEAIKAYGNAWVPQVAYEIFRAINSIGYDENTNL